MAGSQRLLNQLVTIAPSSEPPARTSQYRRAPTRAVHSRVLSKPEKLTVRGACPE